ncbi:MAG TPA: serine hydrolase domain-containing protein [Symbiobacteriaceae bacterium]|nr:serine hydrolase domain-containing protein [Symbiobacteriaceae bacterium]
MTFDTLAGRLDDLFAPWNRPESPGAALAIVHDGQVVCQKGYGCANLEYGIPITPTTVFHVASLAKQVTALAVLLLEEQGLLSVTDPVHKYLPDLPDFGQPITLEHLLQHTSGLRDQWELLTLAGWRMDDVITREQILRLVRRQRVLNFAPGSAYLYGNTGYTLLAEVVATVSGQSLRQFAQTHIFEPLAMHQTHFRDDHEEIVPNLAYSYRPAPDGNGFKKFGLHYATVGATSLLTTAADLTRWLANFEHPSVGSPDLFRRMQTPAVLTDGQTVDYGYGLGLGTHRGYRMVQHIGIDAGYRAFLCWLPELHVGAVVLANLATIEMRSLGMQAVERYLDGKVDWRPASADSAGGQAPAPQPQRITLGDADLQQYAGTYYSDELDTTYRIAPENGDLVARHLRREDLRCVPVAPDTFVAGSLTLRFVRNGSHIAGLRLDGVRVRNLWFARRQ